jgi:hypothetical protein
MKIFVLIEQRFNGSTPDRQPLASGEVYDLDAAWAKELLARGDAEPVATKSADRAEKRPSTAKASSEKRGD